MTIKGAKQAVQMFGPAQAAVARAVVDSVESGVIPQDKADDLCILVGVFIHWDASDDQKIYDYNYQATKESIARALGKQADGGRSHSPAPRPRSIPFASAEVSTSSQSQLSPSSTPNLAGTLRHASFLSRPHRWEFDVVRECVSSSSTR